MSPHYCTRTPIVPYVADEAAIACFDFDVGNDQNDDDLSFAPSFSVPRDYPKRNQERKQLQHRPRRQTHRQSSAGSSSSSNTTATTTSSASSPSKPLVPTIKTKKVSRSSKNCYMRRSVCFEFEPTVHEIERFDEIPDRGDIWYNEQELRQMKIDTSALIKQIRNGLVHINEDTETLRGLDGKLSFNRRRRSSWIMALSCVLDEQKRQQKLGLKDPFKLAKLYRSFVIPAQDTAIAIGSKDYQDVYG